MVIYFLLKMKPSCCSRNSENCVIKLFYFVTLIAKRTKYSEVITNNKMHSTAKKRQLKLNLFCNR